MEAGAPRGYRPSTTVGAILATVFVPLIALIGALYLLGSETDPHKRAFLRTWAWASGIWMVVPVVIVILLATGVWF
jgi:hypothetical protein